MHTPVKLLTVFVVTLLSGCVGSPIHSTVHYNNVQMTTKKNNAALLNLRVGMTKPDVQKIMGQPERSEGYQWGSAWLYRTAMTSGVYGTADSDFTPIVFDAADVVSGWGRNFFTETERRYRLDVNVTNPGK